MAVLQGSKEWVPVDPPEPEVLSHYVSRDCQTNPINMRYFMSPQDHQLYARALFSSQSAGQLHQVHQGAQSAALCDYCMVLAWFSGYRAVIISYESFFIQPVPLLTELTISGKLGNREGQDMEANVLISNDREQILTKTSLQLIV